MNYSNLEKTLAIFTSELDLDKDQNLGSLELSLKSGYINKEELVNELKSSMSDSEFKWMELGIKHKLFTTMGQYGSDENVKEYVKSLLWLHIFPEDCLDNNEIDKLLEDVLSILKEYTKNNGWMTFLELYELLKENKAYETLERFYLYEILPRSKWKIEINRDFDNPLFHNEIRYKYNKLDSPSCFS